jgi:hypothetical protein
MSPAVRAVTFFESAEKLRDHARLLEEENTQLAAQCKSLIAEATGSSYQPSMRITASARSAGRPAHFNQENK